MDEPLENLYFNWLCAKVLNLKPLDNSVTYWELLRKLHRTEFVWVISGDDNRAEDGKELRREFILQAEVPDDPEWRTLLGCSVLEMLIAFARRAEFQDETPLPVWFWEFLSNLELDKFSDQAGFDSEFVEMVLDDLIWRTYNPDGNGGLFPIKNPPQDQRDVEIWYQFCEYLVDQDRLP
jgi:hypothetical protein